MSVTMNSTVISESVTSRIESRIERASDGCSKLANEKKSKGVHSEACLQRLHVVIGSGTLNPIDIRAWISRCPVCQVEFIAQSLNGGYWKLKRSIRLHRALASFFSQNNHIGTFSELNNCMSIRKKLGGAANWICIRHMWWYERKDTEIVLMRSRSIWRILRKEMVLYSRQEVMRR